MHWLRLFLFVIVPMLLALAAPALLLWAWGNDMPLLPASLVGLLILAGAIVIHLLGQLGHAQDADIDALWHEVEGLRQQLRQLQATKPDTASPDAASAAPATVTGQASPEQTSQALATVSAEITGEQQQAPAAAAIISAGDAATTLPPQTPPAVPAGFQLYMETVHALADGQTRMYRALPSLPAEGGGIHLGRNAQLRARTLGQAAALQWHALLGCLRFAEALRQRDCLLPVICPLDVAVLEQPGNGEALLALLQQPRWQVLAAQALLPSVAAEELSESGRTAHGALLALDGMVAGFVLQHGALPVADAPLPLPLTVRHFDVPAVVLDDGALASIVAATVNGLRERGIDIIASNVDDDARLQHLRALAILGRGRAIAVPRRVRLEETTNTGGQVSATKSPAATSGGATGEASHGTTAPAAEEDAPTGPRRVLVGGR